MRLRVGITTLLVLAAVGNAVTPVGAVESTFTKIVDSFTAVPGGTGFFGTFKGERRNGEAVFRGSPLGIGAFGVSGERRTGVGHRRRDDRHAQQLGHVRRVLRPSLLSGGPDAGPAGRQRRDRRSRVTAQRHLRDRGRSLSTARRLHDAPSGRWIVRRCNDRVWQSDDIRRQLRIQRQRGPGIGALPARGR